MSGARNGELEAENARPLRQAWKDSSAFGSWMSDGYPPASLWRYRIALRVCDWLRGSIGERWDATKMLVHPDDPGGMYVGRGLRAKALLLLWLLPIRWCYPDWSTCRHCDQVCGYDESRYGGEYDSWEATFVAIPWGWSLGRAHIYRDGGP